MSGRRYLVSLITSGVKEGTYSITINYSSDDSNSDTYFEICNLADDSVIVKASASTDNETIINNVEVNDTSDLIIKCFKKDGYSLTLKSPYILEIQPVRFLSSGHTPNI